MTKHSPAQDDVSRGLGRDETRGSFVLPMHRVESGSVVPHEVHSKSDLSALGLTRSAVSFANSSINSLGSHVNAVGDQVCALGGKVLGQSLGLFREQSKLDPGAEHHHIQLPWVTGQHGLEAVDHTHHSQSDGDHDGGEGPARQRSSAYEAARAVRSDVDRCFVRVLDLGRRIKRAVLIQKQKHSAVTGVGGPQKHGAACVRATACGSARARARARKHVLVHVWLRYHGRGGTIAKPFLSQS